MPNHPFDRPYLWGGQGARQIEAVVKRVEAQIYFPQQRYRERAVSSAGLTLAYTQTAITARVGTVTGKGMVYLVTDAVDSMDDDNLTITSTLVKVRNISGTPGGIAANKYCWIAQTPGGQWGFVSGEC